MEQLYYKFIYIKQKGSKIYKEFINFHNITFKNELKIEKYSSNI